MAKDNLHGIALRSASIEYTTLAKTKDVWNVSVHNLQPRDLPEKDAHEEDEETPDARTALLSDLRPLAHEWKGLANVSLRADQLLLRVVDLPTTDPDELLGMMELQIEKFSPFPVDTLTVSYETLAETESSSRVLIVAVKNDVVDDLGDVFHELGVTVRWIDVDVLGWWHWLTKYEKVEKFGREAILMNFQDSMMLVVAQNGSPLALRAIPGLEEMTPEERSDTVAEEVDFTLTSLETEWGGVDHTHYSLWTEGEPSQELANSLGESLQSDIATASLNDLPPLSHALAERAMDRRPGIVDLAPPGWEAEDLARATKKNLLIATAGVIGVCLCIFLVLSVLVKVRKTQLEKVTVSRQEIAEPANQVRAVQNKVKMLRKYIEHDSSSLEVLRSICVSLTDGVDLSSFAYNRNGNISIRGEANSEEPIYKFVEQLQDAPLFQDVKLDRVEQKRRKNQNKSIFRLAAKIQGKPL